jgi:hypothetical protein
MSKDYTGKKIITKKGEETNEKNVLEYISEKCLPKDSSFVHEEGI